MPRTVDPAGYAIRRDAFVDVATGLIQTKGYEQMSIQDVLDALDASRGAFYHYFGSKEDLLEAVLDRMIEGAMAIVRPVIEDPARTAPTKLREVFAGIAAFKERQRGLVLAFLDVWMSDRNAIVREKLRRRQGTALVDILEPVIAQGLRDGDFRTHDGPATTVVLTGLMQACGDDAARLVLAHRDGRVTYEEVRRRLEAYRVAFERILGAEPGSVRLLDDDALRAWFESPATATT